MVTPRVTRGDMHGCRCGGNRSRVVKTLTGLGSVWAISRTPNDRRHSLNSLSGLVMAGYDAIPDLLQKCDFVTLHLPLVPETVHLVDWRLLSLMKHEAVLINTSRGRLVNELDLVRALEQRMIRGASLDVTELEPLPRNSPIRRLKNVIVTCHQAAHTHKAIEIACKEIAANITKWQVEHRL